MAIKRRINFEEFKALPTEVKNDENFTFLIPQSSIPPDIKQKQDNKKSYKFKLTTNEYGKAFFNYKFIPENINEIVGFATDFFTLTEEEKKTIKFGSVFNHQPDTDTGHKVFDVEIEINKKNLEVEITFDYL
jgi:hypothetical protein